MSAVVKCLVGLFVIVCFMHFVEMARVRRDEAKPATSGDIDVTQTVNELLAKLKGALDDDTVKKLMTAATSAIQEGTKTVQNHLEEITNKLGSAVSNSDGAPAGH